MLATSALFILQIALLLTVAGLQDNAWYILAVGSLGMLQNGVAAGARRVPSTSGIHLTHSKTIHDNKVFKALQQAEAFEKHVGVSLLPIFFPGGLKKQEEEWRQKRVAELEQVVSTDSEKKPSLTPHSNALGTSPNTSKTN